MNKLIDKILKRIAEKREDYYLNDDVYDPIAIDALDFACDVIEEEVKEYDNGWISCSERLPEEHDSIFAEYKGTNKWKEAMFEKISDDVNVTVKYENGTVKTMTMHTIDGKWKIDSIVKCEVIAWQPLPPVYSETN